MLSGGIFLRRLCTVVGNKNGKNHFFDLLFFKNGLYFEISHTSGRLVQLARTLPSHGRGHRFESCSAHHPSLGAAELRMASHHFRPKGGNDECRHRTRRGRMSSLARSASEDGHSRKSVQRMTFGAELRMASHHFRPKGGNDECRHRTRRGRMSSLARSASEDGRSRKLVQRMTFAAELRMASHHTRRGRMSSLARSASEDGSEFSAINGVLMFYTYILRSLSHPAERYIGSTEDLKLRLIKHNKGDVPHTSKFIPWKVEAYFAFETQEKAAAFERYLKSGSGHAFARRHF